MKHEENALAIIEIITDKLQRLSPAYVRKVMLYATSLLNIQEEREKEAE